MNKFLEGMAMIFDLGCTFPRRTHIPDDVTALRSDWQAVGDDIRKAIGEFSDRRKRNKVQ